ncbi:chitinase 3 precursor [Tribolium castaneum]|uniref:Chitinase 3 n=1 Tax=Tribolium castaneum TaxID=7070 RepID=Q5FYY8_TRICA|nr:chitinase 3 precursor [Tribolium castaneum]AAW67570.1 chitinase 3 [Tribolium castaneum]|eukprot:NP_001034515.1 chitinase 3 precursor [Tribolium castaneum]
MSKLLAILAFASAFMVLSASAGNVVCYFASWTIYRPDNGKFTALDTDPNLCTHILYAFVGLREDGSVSVLDDWEMTGLEELAHLMSLKEKNPNVKILLSMGGWNEGSQKYSQVAANPGLRQAMVTSVLSFIDQYGFDGFDLDWEYPCQRGGVDEDKVNFVTLLGELKSALNAKGLILSAAVSGGIASCKLSYDIAKVAENLDMINVMAYDFHGAFEPFVGHYAPLYASHLDQTDEQKTLNVAAGIQYWLDEGAPPSKINLGLGSYGRGFALADPTNTSLYAATYGGSEAGPYTRAMGVIGYNEVCELYSDWDYFWDDEQQVPHIVKGNQWLGFDDPKSIQLKVEFANSKNLGGVMVWSLDTDDFRGICGNGPYPILNAIKNTLH